MIPPRSDPLQAPPRAARRPGAVDWIGGRDYPPAAPLLERRSALADAYRALLRGAAFVSGQAGDGRDGGRNEDLPHDRAMVRLIGNRLCELDRFLGTMAEEAALHLGPAGHDGRAFARLRNSPNKLRAVRGMMALDSPDHEPLRAVGRVRDCLHHCGGRVHGPAEQRRLASARRLLGGREPIASAGQQYPCLVVSPHTLTNICALYRRAANDLMGEIHRFRPLAVDFSEGADHIAAANVACDGI